MIYDAASFSTYRHDFPMMAATNRGKPLVFLDSAASAQKPLAVINAMQQFYSQQYANIHRGIYEISESASHQFEQTRETVRQFIGAKKAEEIIFVSGTTAGINFIANTLSLGSDNRQAFKAGDEVILTEMEHHANIVPWYLLAKRIGIRLRVVPINDEGELDLAVYQSFFNDKTKLVAVSHVSNVLGTINPIKTMAEMAHHHNVPILVDGAQAAPHLPLNVTQLDVDFYTFSAHKLYGPTGIGVLYINERFLHDLPPYQGGGNMIRTVSFDEVTFAKPPHCFEAGTPSIASVIGLHAAINYLSTIGMDNVRAHELELLDYAETQLKSHPEITIYGRAKEKVGLLSFTLGAVHPHDIGTILDHAGIAVRAGHHCAMPLMERFKVPAMVRIAFGIYNNTADIDHFFQACESIKGMFQ